MKAEFQKYCKHSRGPKNPQWAHPGSSHDIWVDVVEVAFPGKPLFVYGFEYEQRMMTGAENLGVLRGLQLKADEGCERYIERCVAGAHTVDELRDLGDSAIRGGKNRFGRNGVIEITGPSVIYIETLDGVPYVGLKTPMRDQDGETFIFGGFYMAKPLATDSFILRIAALQEPTKYING